MTQSSPKPNFASSWLSFKAIVCLYGIVGLFAGCESGSKQASTASPADAAKAHQRENDGRELLHKVLDAYANAQAYHDDARIVVRYRLNGSPMEEHQLWAIDARQPSHLAARLFNARIQSDANRTTAMVFDFDSQNMDNQYLVLPSQNGPPWDQMFADPVCRHFISGSSEIPFNPRLAAESNLPPTIGLIFGEPPVPWLKNPDRVERRDDVQIDGRTLHCLRITHDRRQYELFIDPQTLVVTQATLPNQFLDDALQIAPEVTDLRLSVQFQNATFQPAWATDPFSTELPESANPVVRFVPLPEAFPSESIGRPLPELSVTGESGSAATWSAPKTPTVLAWVDRQTTSLELIRRLESLAGSGAQAIRVQLCFIEYPDPNPQVQRPLELPLYIRQHDIRLPIVSDVGFAAGQRLNVKFAPTAIVLDADGVVQFFQAIADDSELEKLFAAVDRVKNGENLAAEMRADYTKFLDEYQAKLRNLNPLTPATEPVTKPVSHHTETARPATSPPLWEYADARQPGNLVGLPAGKLGIIDGWQSVIEFDPQSNTGSRHQLELEPDNSITTLRTIGIGAGARIAAFSEMGRQAIVLDQAWKTVGSLVCQADALIRDVQLTDQDADGVVEIWLLDSKGHLCRYNDSLDSALETISVDSAESFDSIHSADPTRPRFLVVRNDGSLVAISNDLQVEPAFAFGQMKIHRFLAASGAGLLAAAIALDEHGQWQAIGISTKLEVAWTVPIGPQEFERQLQPIAELCIDGGKSIWAFASSDDTVSIISHEGKRLDNIQWPESIQGLALQASDDKFNLVVADAKAVSAVPIAPADSESHAQR